MLILIIYVNSSTIHDTILWFMQNDIDPHSVVFKPESFGSGGYNIYVEPKTKDEEEFVCNHFTHAKKIIQ